MKTTKFYPLINRFRFCEFMIHELTRLNNTLSEKEQKLLTYYQNELEQIMAIEIQIPEHIDLTYHTDSTGRFVIKK